MFSASQEKVEQGFEFQASILKNLETEFSSVVDTRKYFLQLNPSCSEVFLNLKESQNGDIMIGPLDHNTYHIECITSAEETIFPETKLRNFRGTRHYYVFLVADGETHVVHSNVWNSYITKCPEVTIKGRKYRKFKSRNVSNLRNKMSFKDFKNLIGEKHD